MDYASSILSLLPGGRRALGINQLISKLENYLPADQVESVQQAYEFGAAAHKGQKRLSGEPFISHPIAAANILADLHVDAETIIAAILHDVIEDTPTAMEQLVEQFGREVADLVDGVTKLDQIKFKSREEAQAESFRKMLLAMVRDIRVILVKLADRIHNMRTLDAMPLPKRRSDRARDARHLRADRRPPRALQHQARARGARLPRAVSAALPHHRERAQARARQPEAVRGQDRGQPALGAGEGRDQGERSKGAKSTSTACIARCARRACR